MLETKLGTWWPVFPLLEYIIHIEKKCKHVLTNVEKRKWRELQMHTMLTANRSAGSGKVCLRKGESLTERRRRRSMGRKRLGFSWLRKIMFLFHDLKRRGEEGRDGEGRGGKKREGEGGWERERGKGRGKIAVTGPLRIVENNEVGEHTLFVWILKS